MKRNVKYLLILIFLVYYSLFFLFRISFFVNVDLGRHLKNGELFIKERIITSTNYFSYTEPDLKVVNHHWGSGVVYYLLQKAVGFKGLTIFNMLLYLAIMTMLLFLALKKAETIIVFLLALLLIPLLTLRPEIRPEVFSYFMTVLFFFLLNLHKDKKIKVFPLLMILSVLQILWVNLHVMFFLGPFIAFVFVIDDVILNRKPRKRICLFPIILLLVCLLNPAGWNGLLEPFRIRQGFTLIPGEIRSLFNFNHYREISSFYFPRYLMDFCTLFTGIIVLGSIIKNKWKSFLPELLITSVFLMFAWLMLRNIALFSMFFLILASSFLSENLKLDKKWMNIVVLATSIFLGIVIITQIKYYNPLKSKIEIGLTEGEENAAKYFISNKMKGPIFNNYDIGGYLIYYLFPQTKMFIDPRPEAYTREFVLQNYWPIKQNNNKNEWQKLDNKYKFNTIILTNTGSFKKNNFIADRSKDSNWVKCFEDKWVVIFRRK